MLALRHLILGNADVNARYPSGDPTALHRFYKKSNITIMSILLASPAIDPNGVDADNQTPLFYAAKSPFSFRAVELLLTNNRIDVFKESDTHGSFLSFIVKQWADLIANSAEYRSNGQKTKLHNRIYKRKQVVNALIDAHAGLYAQLEMWVGPNLINTENKLFIGCTLFGEPVTSETPGFEKAIFSLSQLDEALKAGIFNLDDLLRRCAYQFLTKAAKSGDANVVAWMNDKVRQLKPALEVEQVYDSYSKQLKMNLVNKRYSRGRYSEAYQFYGIYVHTLNTLAHQTKNLLHQQAIRKAFSTLSEPKQHRLFSAVLLQKPDSAKIALLEILIQLGLNVNCVDESSIPLVESAASYKDKIAMQYLLAANANIDIVLPNGSNLLSSVTDPVIMRELLATKKLDVNRLNSSMGRSPLSYAAAGCNFNIIEELLLARADIFAGSQRRASPLEIIFNQFFGYIDNLSPGEERVYLNIINLLFTFFAGLYSRLVFVDRTREYVHFLPPGLRTENKFLRGFTINNIPVKTKQVNLDRAIIKFSDFEKAIEDGRLNKVVLRKQNGRQFFCRAVEAGDVKMVLWLLSNWKETEDYLFEYETLKQLFFNVRSRLAELTSTLRNTHKESDPKRYKAIQKTINRLLRMCTILLHYGAGLGVNVRHSSLWHEDMKTEGLPVVGLSIENRAVTSNKPGFGLALMRPGQIRQAVLRDKHWRFFNAGEEEPSSKRQKWRRGCKGKRNEKDQKLEAFKKLNVSALKNICSAIIKANLANSAEIYATLKALHTGSLKEITQWAVWEQSAAIATGHIITPLPIDLIEELGTLKMLLAGRDESFDQQYIQSLALGNLTYSDSEEQTFDEHSLSSNLNKENVLPNEQESFNSHLIEGAVENFENIPPSFKHS